MTTLAVVPNIGPETPVLEGRDLTKSFWVKRSSGLLARRSRLHAVDDVSVQLDAGAVTAVVGESGSGKTTVARLLARIVKPDTGEVLLDGHPVAAARYSKVRGSGADGVSGSIRVAQPGARIRHHLIRPLQIHHTADGDVDAAVTAVAAPGRARPTREVRRQVSPRALRWPAPACRDRPSPCGAPPRACSPMNRCRCSMCRSVSECSTCLPIFATVSSSQSSTSPTISPPRDTWPTRSW